MKINISAYARKSLTHDEYKYLILLEFSDWLEVEISRIRKELGMPKTLDQLALQQKSLELVVAKNVPISLESSIRDLVCFGAVHTTTIPILILGVDHQLNRKWLYEEKIRPKPSKIQIEQLRRINPNPRHTITENWYDSNKDIFSKRSIDPAIPLIQINKRLSKKQLFEAIEDKWNVLEEVMDDFEKSIPYPTQLSHIPINELERNMRVYRYRKEKPPLSYNEIKKKLELEGAPIAEEETLRKRYSDMDKLVKELGIVSK